MNDMEHILARWQERQKHLATISAHNRRTIFAALAALGIETVEVDFDGCGDSGQIESIVAFGATDQLSGEVTIISAETGGEDERRTVPLTEAMDDLCYTLLEATHDGWEINDGAFGTFTFDVASRQIELEFNGRYTAYDTDVHTFGDDEEV